MMTMWGQHGSMENCCTKHNCPCHSKTYCSAKTGQEDSASPAPQAQGAPTVMPRESNSDSIQERAVADTLTSLFTISAASPHRTQGSLPWWPPVTSANELAIRYSMPQLTFLFTPDATSLTHPALKRKQYQFANTLQEVATTVQHSQS